MSKALNTADWRRIEAALIYVARECEGFPAHPAYLRTHDKVQSHNFTGPYTPQGGRTA